MTGQNCKISRVAGAISPFTFSNYEQNKAKFHPRGGRPEDRYSIVQEAIRDGHAETCRKYNGSGHPVVAFLAAKVAMKYLSKGKEGLKDSYPRIDPQLRALEPGRRSGRKRTLEWDRPCGGL